MKRRARGIRPTGMALALLGGAILFAVFPDHRTVWADKEAAGSAIRHVLDAQVEAWNKGDLDAFMTGYWKSPDLTFFSGKNKTRGWKATLQRYRKKYGNAEKKMGKLTFRDLEVDVVGPAAGWVRGRWKLVRDKETLGGLFTLIFKKLPEGWRIVHDHTSGG